MFGTFRKKHVSDVVSDIMNLLSEEREMQIYTRINLGIDGSGGRLWI